MFLSQVFLMEKKRFLTPLFLPLMLLLAYFFLSEGKPFISYETISFFYFHLGSFHNIIFYSFVHESIFHLAGNFIGLLFFSLVICSAINARNVFGVFFFSSVLAGIFFVLANPQTALLGASAGVSGLGSAAFLLNPKKTIFAIISVFLVVFFVATPLITVSLTSTEQSFVSEEKFLEKEFQKAVSEKNFVLQEQVLEKKKAIQEEFFQFEQGKEFAKKTPTNHLAHILGGIFGIIYVLLFFRKNAQDSALNAKNFFLKLKK
jgi:membrane associated rhomboid family serine protease